MSVHDFQTRVNEICEYFPYMPRPRDTIPVTPRIQTPDDNNKISILHSACPRSLRDEQARTNQLDLDLQHLLSYYSTLKSIERGSDEDKKGRPRNRGSNRGSSRNSPRITSEKNVTPTKYDPICPIHGNHTVSQCKLIKEEKLKFQEKKKTRSNFKNNRDNNGSRNSGWRSSSNNYNNNNNRNN